MTRSIVPTLLILTVVATVSAQQNRTSDGPLDPVRFHLDAVTDRTELTYEEGAAYYALLDHVRQVDPETLRRQAAAFLAEREQERPDLTRRQGAGFPTFVDMLQHPDAWRGEPVTLSGHSLRVDRYAAADNEFGISDLYEMWLVTDDSQGHPATVIFTDKPDDLPVGEELVDGIRVTGYFLKLHTYSSRDEKVRLAPMILAHTVRWRKPTPVQPPVPAWVAYVTIGVVCVVAIAVLWRVRGADRAARSRLMSDSNQFEPPRVDEADLASDDVFPAPPEA